MSQLHLHLQLMLGIREGCESRYPYIVADHRLCSVVNNGGPQQGQVPLVMLREMPEKKKRGST